MTLDIKLLLVIPCIIITAIICEIVKEKNKYIVYSGAQTGKTTELRNLCWELQECGLFMPVSYEVKSSYDLKQDDMPQNKWIDGKEVVVIIDALDEINVSVANSTFTNNSATSDGGAIYASSAKITVSGASSFAENSANR